MQLNFLSMKKEAQILSHIPIDGAEIKTRHGSWTVKVNGAAEEPGSPTIILSIELIGDPTYTRELHIPSAIFTVHPRGSTDWLVKRLESDLARPDAPKKAITNTGVY